MTYANAATQLSSIIQDFLSSKPKMTLNRLADLSKVSEASLRRVVNGETKASPGLRLTIKVLREITGEKSFIELCKTHSGPLADYLYSELALDQLTKDQENYRSQLQNKVNDPIIFHVLALSGSPVGVTEEQVENFFGVEGIKALMGLYEENFLYLNDGRFHTTEKGISFTRDIFLPVLKKTTDLIDTKESPMDSDNFFYLWTSALNNRGVQKLRKIKLEAYQKMKELTKDEKYHGEKHIFFFGALDSYEKNGLKK